MPHTAAPATDAASIGTSVRLDAELVRRGLARSRDDAVELITDGAVTVAGQLVRKPSARVTRSTVVTAQRAAPAYVSRGAHKLAGALEHFAVQGLVVRGRRCIDVGASTGGFTEVLLAAGAASIDAVDVGAGQLAPALAADGRVRVHDGVNARNLTPEQFGTADLVVIDVSFISLALVVPAVESCLAPDGDVLAMVKPQFEVGRAGLDGRGVVRDPAQRVAALTGVATAAASVGLGIAGVVASVLPGPSGNVEYFLWLRHGAGPVDPAALRAAVEAGPA